MNAVQENCRNFYSNQLIRHCLKTKLLLRPDAESSLVHLIVC